MKNLVEYINETMLEDEYQVAAQLLDDFVETIYSNKDKIVKAGDYKDHPNWGSLTKCYNASFWTHENEVTSIFHLIIAKAKNYKNIEKTKDNHKYAISVPNALDSEDDKNPFLIRLQRSTEGEGIGFLDIYIHKDLINHPRYGKVLQKAYDKLVTFPVRKTVVGPLSNLKDTNDNLIQKHIENIAKGVY